MSPNPSESCGSGRAENFDPSRIRPNWRDLPFDSLNEAEIAQMSQREFGWWAEFQAITARNAERLARVDAAVRVAPRILPRCGNCHDWRNAEDDRGWGGCWSRDSMGDDEFDAGARRSTLAVHSCEAWNNENAIFLADGFVGRDVSELVT